MEIPAEISTEWRRFAQLSAQELYDLLRFRQQVFVVEQGSPYPDLDGVDQTARHLLLHQGNTLGGCLRLAPMPGPPPLRSGRAVGIGRVALAPQLRGRGLGRMLMDLALRRCREEYPKRPVTLRAQIHLAPFYRSFGFAATSEPFDDFGVAHVEMAMPAPV